MASESPLPFLNNWLKLTSNVSVLSRPGILQGPGYEIQKIGIEERALVKDAHKYSSRNPCLYRRILKLQESIRAENPKYELFPSVLLKERGHCPSLLLSFLSKDTRQDFARKIKPRIPANRSRSLWIFEHEIRPG